MADKKPMLEFRCRGVKEDGKPAVSKRHEVTAVVVDTGARNQNDHSLHLEVFCPYKGERTGPDSKEYQCTAGKEVQRCPYTRRSQDNSRG